MDKKYRLIFSGEVKKGYDKRAVQEKLAQILKKDEQVVAKLFSGTPRVIKKNADRLSCEKIQKVFLSVGAVSVVEEMPQNTSAADAGQPVAEGAPASPEEAAEKSEKRGLSGLGKKILEKTSASEIAAAKEKLIQSKEKGTHHYREARSSMQHDLNTGGIEQLVRNRYFHYTLGIIVVLAVLLFGVLTYENNPMPLNRQNLQALGSHIEFIEQSFTIQGLEKRSGNSRDYLEYLFVEPIDKLGYNFADTLESIVEDYLDDEFSQTEVEFISKYLQTAADEREKLQQAGLISKGLSKKLKKVSDRSVKKP